jgi:hypothetical protein
MASMRNKLLNPIILLRGLPKEIVAFLRTINQTMIFTVALQIQPLFILDPRAEGL